MFKAIFWDNDGVLVDTESFYFLATQEILLSVGVSLTEEMYIELLLVQNRGAWHLAEQRGIGPAHIQTLRAQRDARYLELINSQSNIIDGVEDVLKSLHTKYVMGVVTSSRREHFEAIHRRTNILKYFSFVLASEDYTRHKPDPEPYATAVRKTGFANHACLAVEDSERGLASAAAAGLKCIVIPRGLTRNGKFVNAYRVVKSVRDIPSALQ
jgi:HAD superfamily hydrolase (TIGR01509 family)